MPNPKFYAESPESVGIDSGKLTEVVQRVRREVDDGLLPSAQIAVAKEGRLVLFETFGDATNDSLYCVFSATKAITSAAAWLLIEAGELSVDEVVADIVPEFATNGKEVVTVEQLFLHTAGFPNAPFRPTDWLDRDRRLARFAQWRLNWEPGTRFEYHPSSSMWVVAEIIERRTGRDFTEFTRTEVADPLGLKDLYVGLPGPENPRVTELTHCGDPMTSADYERLGIPEPPVTEVTEEAILSFNRAEIRAVGVPGGGGIMSAAELALFYQGLIHGGSVDGRRIWRKSTLEMARTVRSGDLRDPMSGVPVNRGLGIVVAGDEYRNFRGFARDSSPFAFGHGGAGGQIAWGDPVTGISIGYCTNGHDRNPMRLGRRGLSISKRVAALGAR
ncbi:MAG: beta-lactamase family protein [Gammaproteobacteria bacterium]|nr:beta-lactamase family protein [Gammaproteobacteria bacterium]MYK47299.1 beta-lactamase family protein [Gammaproteobacteria bacterium]